MVSTRAGAKRKQPDGKPLRVPAKNKKRSPILEASCQSRALSVVPYQPIRILEVHNVTNLYLFQAFGLRAVAERVHRHSTSLVRRNVVRRLQYLKESFEQDTRVDENVICKSNQITQETLDYLSHYMKQQDEAEPGSSKESFLDVFTAGLETLARLPASAHFRQALIEKVGWPLLIELLRRHYASLRAPVCKLLCLCFAEDCGDEFMSAFDRDWNLKCLELFMEEKYLSIVFHEDFEHWGLSATEWTIKLMTPICRTMIRMPQIARENEILLTTIHPLSVRYATHFASVTERFNETERALLALQAEKLRLCDELNVLECRQMRILTLRQPSKAVLLRIIQDYAAFKARWGSVTPRLDEMSAQLARLRL
ncbi:hypothetical protein MPSEU_001053100 [Mayamaea pseudoterrestris]|nr:hypothetical protein MPSEU_001053100 [Mayamaea pseudoterrestris]